MIAASAPLLALAFHNRILLHMQVCESVIQFVHSLIVIVL